MHQQRHNASTPASSSDIQWMHAALALAQTMAGRTSPNPTVGAIVVDAAGQEIGRGVHAGPGQPHAEVEALRAAGARARGSTLYVTLEPCSHHGRTPPCTEAVIQAGVRRVVCATVDPNPAVNGNGIRTLRAAGIEVTVPCAEQSARLLNKHFITHTVLGRPYVYHKTAQSIDGKIATHTGRSQWITSPQSRDDGHRLRAHVDAIAVGIGTVLADDPRLTARPPDIDQPTQPRRIIVDSLGRTPADARILSTGESPVLIAVTQRAQQNIETLRERGADVWVSPGAGETVDIAALLNYVGSLGVNSVLLEGGPTLAGAFWDLGLVDELLVYSAPRIIGGRRALSSLGGRGRDALTDHDLLVDATWEPMGPDLKFSGRVPRPFLGDRAADAVTTGGHPSLK